MRDPRAAPEGPPLVSSWGTLIVATLSAIFVFLTALAVVAWSRRDVPLARPPLPPVVALDAGIHDVDAGLMSDAGTRVVDGGLPIDAGLAPGGNSGSDAGSAQALVDAGPHAKTDAGDPDVVGEEEARALLLTHEESVIACVRDAHKRDPASDDRVTVRVARDAAGTPILSLERSPSPFATRCLKDVLGEVPIPLGRSLRVVLRARADALEIVRMDDGAAA